MDNTRTEITAIEDARRRRGSEGIEPLVRERRERAKAAFSTRRVNLADAELLDTRPVTLAAGDLVLARVDRTRQHGRLELANGRRASLYSGDEIIVSLGGRYAPDQFHAVVPASLGPCSLAAAGGMAATVLSRHKSIKPPTEITLLGALTTASGKVLNLSDYALGRVHSPQSEPTIIAVVGTSMNSGKTTIGTSLIHGLARAGLKVGAAKITGTGAGGDLWKAVDAGAASVVDFTDAGFCSTYNVSPEAIEGVLGSLTDYLATQNVDAIVLEIADGILQPETAALIRSSAFGSCVDHVLFTAGDSMGAVAGYQHLRGLGLPVRAISGAMTLSPLSVQEAQAAVDLPVITTSQLRSPEFAVGAFIDKVPNPVSTQSSAA